ncbi:MAG TPA: hypothetical protein VF559_09445 [Caulobacteraceae bacterium]|jgi:hypothetical protein
MTSLLEIAGWAVLAGAVLAYLAPAQLRPRLTALRAGLALAGLLLLVLAFPLDRALLFGTGFTAAFACSGPLWVAWKYRGAGASAADEPQDQGQQQA